MNIVDENPHACCGTCKHNKNCENYKKNNWICSLWQDGGTAREQLSLFGDDYEN